ncbi:hypothetical protein HHK36_014393 [Tetracentron sinense]|uniref:MADS-box domain-containing protein n=1 Tax=Tetracentron sinense TaxID=13715 RepID=A0A834Z608_TETSI|nr:hypothetical protein HHK36_014393 [Tetracentron sinense]
MGRKKMPIQKLDTENARRVTYSKRRPGLLKKARDLSILCDTDLALVMFSPTEKPTLCLGHNNTLSSVVEKLSHMTFEERVKKQADSVESLMKMYKKDDQEVDPKRFSLEENDKLEELKEELKELQEELAEKNEKLRKWLNPDDIDDPVVIQDMDDKLVEYLKRLELRKASRNQWTPGSSVVQHKPHGNPNMGLAQRDIGGEDRFHESICAQNENAGGQGLEGNPEALTGLISRSPLITGE